MGISCAIPFAASTLFAQANPAVKSFSGKSFMLGVRLWYLRIMKAQLCGVC
jgi:hypothetical protein